MSSDEQTVVSSDDRSNGRARKSTHHDGREEPSVPSASHRVGTMRVACEREEGGKKGSDGRTVRGHQLKQHVSVEQGKRRLGGGALAWEPKGREAAAS